MTDSVWVARDRLCLIALPPHCNMALLPLALAELSPFLHRPQCHQRRPLCRADAGCDMTMPHQLHQTTSNLVFSSVYNGSHHFL